jgi:hypothetical protein
VRRSLGDRRSACLNVESCWLANGDPELRIAPRPREGRLEGAGRLHLAELGDDPCDGAPPNPGAENGPREAEGENDDRAILS